MQVLLSLDGVLATDSGEPIRAGVVLYYSLNNGNRVGLITSRKRADAEQWLGIHGIIGYDDLIADEAHLEGDDLKKRQFILSRGKSSVELYVDSDPSMCAWVLEEQQTPIALFSHPSYSKIEHRTTAPKRVRAWNDIEAAIDTVNLARARDRGHKPSDIGEYSD